MFSLRLGTHFVSDIRKVIFCVINTLLSILRVERRFLTLSKTKMAKIHIQHEKYSGEGNLKTKCSHVVNQT